MHRGRPSHQLVCAVRCLPLGRHPREGGKATRANGCARVTPPHRTPLHLAHHCTPHTIAHHTPLHLAQHCTPHTIAHHKPLHTAHYCTRYTIAPHTIAPHTIAHHTPLHITRLNLTAPLHHTLAPSSFSQVNGYLTKVDAMRVQPRYHASRGGRCASGALLGGLGGLLLAEKGQVVWGWDIAPTQCSWRA